MDLPKHVKIRPNFIFLKWGFRGITIWPFGIYLKRDDYSDMKKLLNHEEIHWKQQKELLGIFFLILYYGEMLILKLFKYKGFKEFFKMSRGGWYDAYRNTAFELEAYINDQNLKYLETRKFGAWTKYLRKKGIENAT